MCACMADATQVKVRYFPLFCPRQQMLARAVVRALLPGSMAATVRASADYKFAEIELAAACCRRRAPPFSNGASCCMLQKTSPAL